MAEKKKPNALAIVFGHDGHDGPDKPGEDDGPDGHEGGSDPFEQAAHECMVSAKAGDLKGYAEALKAAIDIHVSSKDEADEDEQGAEEGEPPMPPGGEAA
jgi:hypothetical protein